MTIRRWLHKHNQGLTGRQKLAAQFTVSGLIAVALVVLQAIEEGYSTRLVVPFLKNVRPDLVWEWMGHIPHFHWLAFIPFVIFVMLVISGSSNAVNLNGWIGWAGDWVHDYCRGGTYCFDLCKWACCIQRLS